MSLDQGFRYESNFGYHSHNNFLSSENYNRPFEGSFMDNNSLNNLYNHVESHDQRFPGADLGHPTSQPFGDTLLGQGAAGTTLKSLLESFGQFDLESGPLDQNGYSGWPTPANANNVAPVTAPVPPPSVEELQHQELPNKSPMKFPSQVLTQNSRASPFSDTTESSLFSNSSSSFSSRLDLQQSQFSSFSTSSLLAPGPGQVSNSLGLSDISSRLEELSQGSSAIMSQGASTRDSTPLSWNPMINYSSSKTSSITSSPTMSQPKTFSKPPYYGGAKPEPEDQSLFSDDEEDKLVKMLAVSQASHPMLPPTAPVMPLAKPKLLKSMSTSCVPESPSGGGATSWSQIVRTSSSKLPMAGLHQSVSPPPVPVSSGPVTRASLTPSPGLETEQEPQLVVEEVPPSTNTVDFHRGPKVDQRWPVAQQVFLGPIPMAITWDEIRNVFYTKVQRRELLHFYVQSKPVNEVVYGQVVFDKPALARKIVKEGPVKVRGHLINVTLMTEKDKLQKRK